MIHRSNWATLALIWLIALVGCGAEAQDEQVEVVETGTAEQPLTFVLDSDYGARYSDDQRCNRTPSNFGSTYCIVPKFKEGITWNLAWGAESTPFEKQAILDGWTALANDAYPNFWWGPEASESTATVVIDVVENELPSGVLGRTVCPVSCGPFCTQGSTRQYGKCRSKIDVGRIRTFYPAARQACGLVASDLLYANIIKHVTAHELGHALGLGHNDTFPDGGNHTVMYTGTGCNNLTTFTLTAHEKHMLSVYDWY